MTNQLYWHFLSIKPGIKLQRHMFLQVCLPLLFVSKFFGDRTVHDLDSSMYTYTYTYFLFMYLFIYLFIYLYIYLYIY